MLQIARATFMRVMLRAYPLSFVIGHILAGVYTVLFAYFTYTYVFAGSLDSRFAQFAGTSSAGARFGGWKNAYWKLLLVKGEKLPC